MAGHFRRPSAGCASFLVAVSRDSATPDEEGEEEMIQLQLIEDPNAFAERSASLRQILIRAGFRKNSGVSTEGIKFVSSTVKKNCLRDWPNTQTLNDYDALIRAVNLAIQEGLK
jgi:hypothetical protein